MGEWGETGAKKPEKIHVSPDISQSHSGYDAPMNWLIVTASNRGQAHGYRIQLQSRDFSGSMRWLVIPDPRNRRVGSGGSTIRVPHKLRKVLRKTKPRARSVRELFEGKRILLIHSGGDSRRLISYAPQGKLLPGAGGGGFIYMIAHDAQAAALVRRKLCENPPNELGRIFDFQIDGAGLQVTVL